MKKLLSILLVSIFMSCSQGGHPDFAKNTATAKKMLELQGSEADFQAQLDLIHQDVKWQPVFFGATEIGKEEFGQYLKACKMKWKMWFTLQTTGYLEYWQRLEWLTGVLDLTELGLELIQRQVKNGK